MGSWKCNKAYGEFLRYAGNSILVESEMMQSFFDAVNAVLKMPLVAGKNFVISGGWEIGMDINTGTIYHALMLGR